MFAAEGSAVVDAAVAAKHVVVAAAAAAAAVIAVSVVASVGEPFVFVAVRFETTVASLAPWSSAAVGKKPAVAVKVAVAFVEDE